MSKVRRVGMEPWRAPPQSEAEVLQATYDRLARRYKGLDGVIIRAAWRRHLDMEPTDQIVEGIRTGRRLRFR
ncbi:MAG: hypothetical protein OES13_02020 [Acidimicrobiia bacterium]|nr:hypothetical protein [Acidimicrobiia bacterium]